MEVTRAYVGDDFIVIDYRITVSATSPIASSAEFVPNFYLRDKQGQYVTNNGGPGATPSYDGDSVVYTGTAVFPPFAQPEEAGAQTLFFGWFPFFRADRANGGLEGAFQSTVVRGAVSHPHVTPAKASGLTLQLVDLSINRTPNPIMTPAIESVRLHLRYSGLPTAPAYDTLVMNSFHSDVMGGSGNGDQSALTLPDGVSGPPAFANLAGRQHFIAGYPMVGCPTTGCIELGPKDEGQMDMMAVFYVSHIPQDGALIFTLDELHFSYEWDSSLDGQPQRSHGYSYADPWTLTIPLSGA